MIHYQIGHEAFENIHVPLDVVVYQREWRYVFQVRNTN